MKIFVFLLAWFMSVVAMSSFSTLMGHIFDSEFREEIILSKLISGNSFNQKDHSVYSILGWFIHFLVGGLFLYVYAIIWEWNLANLPLWETIVFGSVIGFLGIIGWSITFKIYHDPPKINFKGYYIQLFFAHIVFSLVAMIVFQWLR
ncbi:hypothetical protein [Aquimarina intermedia]|uniref:DUF2938 family protein n=1 Tax=Aquimarina intermedia TaxID=350814 RepID=A0A5S5CAT3_9FLAO|nr:hypothetical protein [Aquimarina intermedia]TYP75093.1 hypothetical protein BD809_103156 [Aquimarina intermedia]